MGLNSSSVLVPLAAAAPPTAAATHFIEQSGPRLWSSTDSQHPVASDPSVAQSAEAVAQSLFTQILQAALPGRV